MDEKTKAFQDKLDEHRTTFRQLTDDRLIMSALALLMQGLLNTNVVSVWVSIEELQRRSKGEGIDNAER